MSRLRKFTPAVKASSEHRSLWFGVLVFLSLTICPLSLTSADSEHTSAINLLNWSDPLWGFGDVNDIPEFDSISGTTPDYLSSLDASAEFWWKNKWGVSGYWTQQDVGGSRPSGLNLDKYSLDVKHRLFNSSRNDYLAVGLGWESLQYNGSASEGPRLVLEGRIGLGGFLYFYGQTAWLPELYSQTGIDDLQGNQFEAGLSLQPAPFFSLRAGYRRLRLNHGGAQDDVGSDADGFILGAGFHW